MGIVIAGSTGQLSSIPSPPGGGFAIGPLHFRAYGLCIAVGVVAAVWLSKRRWAARGGVALGVAVGLAIARRRGAAFGPILDVVAPAIPLAQAIGRWGNWFNIELFGRPTTVAWALRVPVGKRPAGYRAYETFHPTFLYESLWNLCVVALVLGVERGYGRRLRPGRLFALYVAAYSFGRFWIERIRIDTASKIFGLRINEWTAAIVFACAAAVVATGRRPAPEDHAEANPAQ